MKTIAAYVMVAAGSLSGASAAELLINNVVAGQGDTLYANQDGTLMNGGSVHMGYFPVTVTSAELDTIPKLLSQLSSFTNVVSGVPGTFSESLGGSFPGYVDQRDWVRAAMIDFEHPLHGRMIYSIVTDAPDLSSVSLQSQFALLAIAKFRYDLPLEEQYTSNPADLAPIIGTLGTFHGDAGAGEGVYLTLEMDVVPEASVGWMTALSGAVLFRRRR